MSAPEELSKSARKRANQKAREAEVAAEAAAATAAAEAAAAAPKSKAKAKGKAKAEPKAEAKAEPKPAEPAAKAKGKAKAEPKAAAPAAAEAAPKAEGKAKAKKKKAEKVEEAPKPPPADATYHFEVDDGMGGEWEMASGLSKKQAKQKDKKDKEEAEAKEAAIALAKAEKAAQKAGQAVVAKTGDSKKDNKAESALKAADEILARARENAKNPQGAALRAAAAAKAAQSAVVETKKEEEKVDDGSVSVSIPVPDGKIGRIIGPKGANIELIKTKTEVKTIDTQGGVVTIVGQPAQVAQAEIAVRELMDKGFMSMQYEDFKEATVEVPSSAIPNIIGERGAIIQVIKKECNVEVNIDQGEKGKGKGDGKGKPDRSAKVKVVLAGESAGVEKAKGVIHSIALFGHSEITHPGWSHEEMDIEDWKYRFIIGAGGSEMRHIQNNFKVKVNIPREGSGSDKVVVIGEAADVDRAVKYITKVTENAEQPTGRDKPEKAEDTWGDEGPSEPWMDAYMYKRR